jgi:hypothetical protein
MIQIIGIALSSVAISQPAMFERWFGGPKYDEAFAIQQTRDGGYIVVGTTLTLTGTDCDVFAIRMTPQGDTVWARAFGGAGNDEGRAVAQSADGNFLIAGSVMHFPPDSNSALLLKVDSLGTLRWMKRWHPSVRDYLWSLTETPDSGFIVVGELGPGPHGRSDGWLVKTNRIGDTMWTRTYGAAGDDAFRCIHLLDDDGYILAGSTNSFGMGGTDFYVVRINASGDTLWTRTYGGPNGDIAYSVDIAADGGYFVAGQTGIGPPQEQVAHFTIMRCNSVGDTLWTRSWNGAARETQMSIAATGDGGCIFAGTAQCGGRGNEALIVKCSASGEEQWQRTFGRAIDDAGSAVLQSRDGGFAIAGMVAENTYDAFIVKTDSLGMLTSIHEVSDITTPTQVHLSQNFPNPFNPVTTITLHVQCRTHVTLTIVDILGCTTATLLDHDVSPGEVAIKWDATGVSSGVYFCQLRSPGATEIRKLILVR